MYLKNEINNLISLAIYKAKKDGAFPDVELPEVKVQYSKEDKFGDYATPFALEAAKVLKRSPMEIAETIKNYIQNDYYISSIEVVKPGFLNVFISNELMSELIDDIILLGDNCIKPCKDNPVRYNIEFVSANPTGPLNVVSARAAAVGDTLANIIEAAGDKADREFYINDFGNQVNLLGRSVYCRYLELKGENPQFPEDGYHGEYIADIAGYIKDKYEDKIENFESEEEKLNFIAEESIKYNVSTQKEVMKKFNVEYDNWFSEKTLHNSGKVNNTYVDLNKKKYLYDEDGKKVFRSTEFGDDKDRVVVRDDGRPTYLMADIAYHADKYNRKYDKLIDIWGPDHHGYIARLKGALQALGYKKDSFEVLIAQQVNLLIEGEQVKMSKRLGNFSTMQDLIDEIGVDAARYFFVMRSMDSHLDFDIELAKKQSSENPVFYLQYAHARICSIFKAAEEKGIKYDYRNFDITQVNESEIISLIKTMIKFPDEIQDSASAMETHHIPAFLMKLAQGFHKMYTEHRILSDDYEKTNSLLVICDCVRIVLRNGLNLLGVSVPEKM